MGVRNPRDCPWNRGEAVTYYRHNHRHESSEIHVRWPIWQSRPEGGAGRSESRTGSMRKRTVEALIEAVQDEARRAAFPVDTPVYQKAGKDPTRPILFAGALDAPVCVFARDLGKDEVAVGQPLV